MRTVPRFSLLPKVPETAAVAAGASLPLPSRAYDSSMDFKMVLFPDDDAPSKRYMVVVSSSLILLLLPLLMFPSSLLLTVFPPSIPKARVTFSRANSLRGTLEVSFLQRLGGP